MRERYGVGLCLSTSFLLLSGLALAIFAAAAMGLASGCGTAEAKPVEVTYYYLPG